MKSLDLKFKKLHQSAIEPVYATDGSACIDLAVHGADWVIGSVETSEQLLRSGSQLKLNTGLSFEVPEGYVMLIFSRSGMGFNNEIRLSNCVGVIDSDYRGEISVALKSDVGGKAQVIRQGDRVAQAMLVEIPKLSLVNVDVLSDTARGANGKGSTGQSSAPLPAPASANDLFGEVSSKPKVR